MGSGTPISEIGSRKPLLPHPSSSNANLVRAPGTADSSLHIFMFFFVCLFCSLLSSETINLTILSSIFWATESRTAAHQGAIQGGTMEAA